jgi:siroheme synthase-like protein
MKNNHRYPIFLDLRGVKCLVVGGGPVALRKVVGLRQAGAEVFVNSPEITTSLRVLADKKAITWIDKKYSPARLQGMRLVIAATNNAEVNHAVFIDAEKRGLFSNVVDDLDYCRFVAPARYSGGSLEIAVTTGGAAPVIAKIVRDDIGDNIGNRYAPVVSLLGKRRLAIKRLSAEAKKAFWQRVKTVVKTTKPGEAISLKKLDALLADMAGGSA